MNQKNKPLVTRKEVSQHNKEDDCWIIVKEKVYSVPKNWLSVHPGGRLTIMSVAGKDATEPFLGFHDEWVLETKLKAFHFANLTPEDSKIHPMLQEYRDIAKEIKSSYLYNTNYFWYFKLLLWISSLYISSFALVIYGTSLLSHIVSAFLLGLAWQQLAFVGHDFAHNAFTHSRYYDSLISTTLAVFLGISCQWWKHTHNVHHIVTNSLEYDPDIQHLPVIAVTEKYFKDVFSLFHGRILSYDKLAQFFVSNQYLFYYPIMAVSRVNLLVQGIILHLKAKDTIPFRLLDLLSLIGYISWYIYLLSLLPTIERSILYFFISHAVNGLLAVQITISHFAMPVYEGITGEEFSYDFLKIQFDHSLDVDCDPWLDWLHGGLQFQVTHHLFPRVPRHNLRYIRDKYVIPFAKKWDLKYNICSFYEANLLVLNTLKETGIKAKENGMKAKVSKGK